MLTVLCANCVFMLAHSCWLTQWIVCVALPPYVITESNQFYLYSSKSHCLNGLYNLYSEWHPLSLDPWFEWSKTSHVDGKKDPFNRVKKNKKQWKTPQEQPQRRDPSSWMDRHAIDVMCTEKNNKSQFTSHSNRKSDTSYIWSELIQEETTEQDESQGGPSEGCLNERGEDEEREEEKGEEEEAIESVESDTACSYWGRKTKTKVREMWYWSE